MTVFEITVPGTWLVSDDRNQAWNLHQLLDNLMQQFFEANCALNLFVASRVDNARRLVPNRESWERDRAARAAIQGEIEASRGMPRSRDDAEINSFDAEVRFKQEQWAAGRPARELEHSIPFLYARAFLAALDSFDKLLGALAAAPGAPCRVATFRPQIAAAFPDLRQVRNSVQHLEDRVRGLGEPRRGQPAPPLVLKPIDNTMIRAPGGALALNNLNGSKYGTTMADGNYGEVDVSVESMEHLRRILQEILGSFAWTGAKRHLPSV